jgi:hypothetical protein
MGASNWSNLTEFGSDPVAEVSEPNITVALHETGPEFTFFIEHANEIATYLDAISTLISTWVTVRLAYRKPQDPVWEPDGTIIEVGDVKVKTGRDLEPEEIISIVDAIAIHAK